MYNSFLEIIEKNEDYSQFPKHLKKEEIYKLISPKYSLYRKIVSVNVSFFSTKENSIATKSVVGDEKEILSFLNNKIFSKGFYILGYKNETYDLPFIFQRMIKHNIIPSSAVYSPNMKPWKLKILTNFLNIKMDGIFDEDDKVTQWWFSGNLNSIQENVENNSILNMLIY